MNYNEIYDREECLGLPRTPRTYFDSCAHECACYPVEKKCLDLGYVIWHGYDIRKVIHDCYRNYPHVSEYDVQFAVNNIMAHLCNRDVLDLLYRENPIDWDIDLLIEELMRRYRLPLHSGQPHYIAEDFRRIDYTELADMNGWDSVADDLEPYKLYCEGKFVAYPGDGYLIRRHNLDVYEGKKGVCEDTFFTYIAPEPWYGNPLSAKVIILGSVPRYDDEVCQQDNLALEKQPAIIEGVQEILRGWWRLSGRGFFDNDLGHIKEGTGYLDSYNSTAYKHWREEIENFCEETLATPQTVFDRISVINATPYFTDGNNPLAAGLMPSHRFLHKLLRYIYSHDKDVIFIIPSEKLANVWNKILEDVFMDMIADGRLICIEKENPNLSLDSSIIGNEIQMRIMNAIYEGLE